MDRLANGDDLSVKLGGPSFPAPIYTFTTSATCSA
jgi:hypothetical protein